MTSAPRLGLLWAVLRRSALPAVLALSAFLNLFRLGQDGYANLYYAAAVRSMLSSWHNFFFVSFDPAGFVSIDKPPAGYWVQAASAKLFGYSGFSMLLPQAIAGIVSVWLLYLLVRYAFGEATGILAALMLATTPINVVTNRNNTVDSLLVAVLLAAAWAVVRADERNSWRCLFLGFALVGVGFNIKMLQAFLVLPALVVAYLATKPFSRGRWRDLTLATVVMAAISLAWIAAVDLTPASDRPYVGGSGNNSEFRLIFHHNGIARISEAPGSQGQEVGSPGPLRFVNQQFADQISWLLPLALGGLAVMLLYRPRTWRGSLNRQQRSMLFWATWLLPQLVFFSYASLFHLYYLVMVAPAISALAAIAVAWLWRMSQDSARSAWVLPAVLGGVLLFQVWIVMRIASGTYWLALVALGAYAIGAVAFLLLRSRHRGVRVGTHAIVAIGIGAVLLSPAVWALVSVWHATDMTIPIAGPESGVADAEEDVDPRLLAFLTTHQDGTRYLAATLTARVAAPLIVSTGEPVMALGGFKGRDEIVSLPRIQAAIADGSVRYFLLPDRALAPAGQSRDSADVIASWVRTSCKQVPSAEWQTMPSLSGIAELPDVVYDCADVT